MYRFWRDSGYVLGGLVSGFTADALGFGGAIAVVAAVTAASGAWVALELTGDSSLQPSIGYSHVAGRRA